MAAALSAISSGFLRQVLRRPSSIVLTVAVGLVLLPVSTSAAGPLSKTEVVNMLKSSEPSVVKEFAIKLRAHYNGIAFPMTPDVEKELKAAGASQGLLETLRRLAPPPPPPSPAARVLPIPAETQEQTAGTPNAEEDQGQNGGNQPEVYHLWLHILGQITQLKALPDPNLPYFGVSVWYRYSGKREGVRILVCGEQNGSEPLCNESSQDLQRTDNGVANLAVHMATGMFLGQLALDPKKRVEFKACFIEASSAVRPRPQFGCRIFAYEPN